DAMLLGRAGGDDRGAAVRRGVLHDAGMVVPGAAGRLHRAAAAAGGAGIRALGTGGAAVVVAGGGGAAGRRRLSAALHRGADAARLRAGRAGAAVGAAAVHSRYAVGWGG